jgi:hypothetical protein
MKSPSPNPYFLSPHMSKTEVRNFVEELMRKEFGPQAELMIQIARVTEQFMTDQEVAAVQPTRSQE